MSLGIGCGYGFGHGSFSWAAIMAHSLFNQHWYRVSKLRPRLHGHVNIHRHDYRNQIWFVMEDTSTGRNHRFNPTAYKFIGLMDGKLSVQEIYDSLSRQMGNQAPSEDTIIQLLSKLHDADLIQTDALVNTEELFERQTRLRQLKINQRLTNPISLQLPLWDPETFLQKNINKVAWMFSRTMGLVWLLTIGYALLQAVSHWGKITGYFLLNSTSPANLLSIFLLYPSVKFIHELGHAFATKIKGGEVHEMGINLLMFFPIPYVNVTSAGHFRNKYDRMLVSVTGIVVESFLAALGLLLFLSTQPGLLKDIGFNVMLIGGVSSLLFNGNPLLKYDGYYFLADALGIPNLYQRAGQFWRYLCQRYLFGLKQVASPATASNESFWFVIYSILSFGYRLFILWLICVYLTKKFFIFGVLLAIWLVITQFVNPLYKAINYVTASPDLSKTRGRAVLALSLLFAAAIGLLGFMPLPAYTVAEGIVWLPDEAQIKAEHDGFIREISLKNDQRVNKGDTVLTVYDDTVDAKAKVARAKLVELQSQYRGERETDMVKADMLKQELRVAQAELDHIKTKTRAMAAKTGKAGRLILPDSEDLPGRYVKHGELLGYVLDASPPVVRMAIPQENIGQFRNRVTNVSIKFANLPEREFSAAIIQQTPEATNKLPSPALATTGGGKIRLDPNKLNELVSLQSFFLIDLEVESPVPSILVGTRAYVRINHGSEPLSSQWYRRIRQAFLSQFNV